VNVPTTSADHSPVAVLFDIDGTLVDSNYAHVSAWMQAFVAAGHPVDAWRIHRVIGMDSSMLLAELLGDDADRFGDEVKERHQEYYADAAPLLHVLNGARELLRDLAERGARVVLATSAPQDELARLQAPTGRTVVRTPDVGVAQALLDGRSERYGADRLLVRGVDAAALNAELVAGGVRVRELGPERRTLEQVVLAATDPERPGYGAA